LVGLKLNGANFQNAILKFADLSETQLVQANFTGANLAETLFMSANVESALFRDVQGISDAQKDQLERQAQRWKFELKARVSQLKPPRMNPYHSLPIDRVSVVFDGKECSGIENRFLSSTSR